MANFGFKPAAREKGQTIKPLKQTGSTNLVIDKERHALQPGKRISKNGNVYWETRKNRSDVSFAKKV